MPAAAAIDNSALAFTSCVSGASGSGGRRGMGRRSSFCREEQHVRGAVGETVSEPSEGVLACEAGTNRQQPCRWSSKDEAKTHAMKPALGRVSDDAQGITLMGYSGR